MFGLYEMLKQAEGELAAKPAPARPVFTDSARQLWQKRLKPGTNDPAEIFAGRGNDARGGDQALKATWYTQHHGVGGTDAQVNAWYDAQRDAEQRANTPATSESVSKNLGEMNFGGLANDFANADLGTQLAIGGTALGVGGLGAYGLYNWLNPAEEEEEKQPVGYGSVHAAGRFARSVSRQ